MSQMSLKVFMTALIVNVVQCRMCLEQESTHPSQRAGINYLVAGKWMEDKGGKEGREHKKVIYEKSPETLHLHITY